MIALRAGPLYVRIISADSCLLCVGCIVPPHGRLRGTGVWISMGFVFAAAVMVEVAALVFGIAEGGVPCTDRFSNTLYCASAWARETQCRRFARVSPAFTAAAVKARVAASVCGIAR